MSPFRINRENRLAVTHSWIRVDSHGHVRNPFFLNLFVPSRRGPELLISLVTVVSVLPRDTLAFKRTFSWSSLFNLTVVGILPYRMKITLLVCFYESVSHHFVCKSGCDMIVGELMRLGDYQLIRFWSVCLGVKPRCESYGMVA